MDKSIEILRLFPNLRVVGTSHGLNDEDKKVLDDIINSVDFVGIEWNYISNQPDWVKKYIHLRPFRQNELRGDHLYLDIMDWLELKDIIKNHVKDQCNQAKRNGRLYEYSLRGNEFLYVQDRCLAKQIQCYMVDQPVTHTWHHYFSYFQNWDFSEPFDFAEAYNVKNRNNHMLKRLQDEVGFLDVNVHLSGALVVGNGHLKLYKESTLQS